jgi:hypothetical protein
MEENKALTAELKTMQQCMDEAARKYHFKDYLDFLNKRWPCTHWDLHENVLLHAAKLHARSVAEQVRQECAEKVRIKDQKVNITVAASTTTTAPAMQIHSFLPPEIDKDSILSIDIEQFII